jgi:hypothetical protein
MYNNAVSFTSLGTQIDYSVQGQKGISVFRMSGALVHFISSIEPIDPAEPGYSQIYVVGDRGTEEVQLRVTKAQGKAGATGRGARLKPKTVLQLMAFLYVNNPYAKIYMTAQQVLKEQNASSFKLQGVPRAGSDPKRYNQPSADEVAIVVQGNGEIIEERQILLRRLDRRLQVISDMHSSYFPLRYPLFFPYGEQQWDDLWCATTPRGEHASRSICERN